MKIKQLSLAIICSILFVLPLTGCGSKAYPTMSDYAITDDESTTAGLQVGASVPQFLDLYNQFDLSFCPSGSVAEEYSSFDPESESFLNSLEQLSGDFLLATFYLDEEPQSALDLSKTSAIDDKSELFDYLRSPEFLSEHTLLYKFMIFHFEDGSLISIESDSLDYNAEYRN